MFRTGRIRTEARQGAPGGARMRTLGIDQSGFTMIELIASISIAAILAVTMSASFSRNVYDTQLTADRLRSAVSYAQKLAIASRRVVTLNFASTTVTVDLCQNFTDNTTDACPALSTAIALPDGRTNVPTPTSTVNFGTNSPANSFKFDAQGRPDLASPMIVTVGVLSGGSVVPGSTVTIEAETGYAR